MLQGIQIIETESSLVQKKSVQSKLEARQISLNSNEHHNAEEKSQRTKRMGKIVEHLQAKKKKKNRESVLVEMNPQKGVLCEGTIKYLEKRLIERCSKFYWKTSKKISRKQSKHHSKYSTNWGRKYNVKRSYYHWCILLNVVLFFQRIKRTRQKKNILVTSTGSDHVVGVDQIKSVFRILISFCLATLIIIVIIPVLLIFDLFLRGQAYINLYILFCLSYTGCTRYLLLIILPAYLICIVIAILVSIFQTFKALGGLMYNMTQQIVDQNLNLGKMIGETFKQPF